MSCSYLPISELKSHTPSVTNRAKASSVTCYHCF